jgi:hypothetical protein
MGLGWIRTHTGTMVKTPKWGWKQDENRGLIKIKIKITIGSLYKYYVSLLIDIIFYYNLL